VLPASWIATCVAPTGTCERAAVCVGATQVAITGTCERAAVCVGGPRVAISAAASSGDDRDRLARLGSERCADRTAVAEVLEQRRLTRAGAGEVALADVAEAADLVGDGRQLNRCLMVGQVEIDQDLLDDALVVGDQFAVELAVVAAREGVQHRAAQVA